MSEKFLQPRPRKLQPLNPRCALVLEAIRNGADRIRGVVVWLKIERNMELPPKVIESDLRTLQRRGLITSEKGKLKVAETIE